MDEDVRELERLARTIDDGGAWARCGRAFARARRFDEAGHAYARARVLGVDCDEDLDELAPSLDELRVIARHDLGNERPLHSMEWTRDGTKLLATNGILREIDPLDGTRRTIGEMSGVFGVGQQRIVFTRGVGVGAVELVSMNLVTGGVRALGTRSNPVSSLVVFGRDDEYVGAIATDQVFAHRIEDATAPRVFHTTALGSSMAVDGRVVVLRRGRTLALLEPLSRTPTATIALDALGDQLEQSHFDTNARWGLVVAAGRRVVLLARRYGGSEQPGAALLVSRDGRLLGHARLPDGFTWTRVCPASPSGRLVGGGLFEEGASQKLALADVVSGSTRSIELDLPPLDRARPTTWELIHLMAWSPSGRKLALATRARLFVIGADAP